LCGLDLPACTGHDRCSLWTDWVANYASIREAIALTFPDIFHDFNERLKAPGGFHRPIAARERRWNTSSGRANFIIPT
jgi:hypothetical protein